jgi:hypothetical protein
LSNGSLDADVDQVIAGLRVVHAGDAAAGHNQQLVAGDAFRWQRNKQLKK